MRSITCAVLATACMAAGPALAQSGGTQIVFGLSSTLRADDNWNMVANPAKESFQFSNLLTLGILSETRSSAARVDLGANLQASRIDGAPATSGLIDPFARASYNRTGATSNFSLGAGLSQTDQGIAASSGDGTRTDANLSVGYAFGTGLPFGGNFSAAHSTAQYQGSTTDTDDQTTSVSGGVRIDLSPKLSIKPSASLSKFEADDVPGTTTDTVVVTFGASAAVSDVTTIDASISDKRINSNVATDTHNAIWSVSMTRQAASGSHVLGLSRDASTAGTRTDLTYDRILDLPDATASFGIGFARGASGSDEVTARINYDQPLPTGSARLSLNRGFVTNADGTESLTANLDASYRKQTSDTSGFRVFASYSEDDQTGGTKDADARFGASWNSTVAQDWDLVVGAEHRISKDDGSPEIHSNALFVTFQRNWISTR